ncbi:MAG: dockerin type I domain-containing protein [Chloroflexota bacterium]
MRLFRQRLRSFLPTFAIYAFGLVVVIYIWHPPATSNNFAVFAFQPTPTYFATGTWTAQPTPTAAFTPTPTITLTFTPTPTATFTPTPSPTPESLTFDLNHDGLITAVDAIIVVNRIGEVKDDDNAFADVDNKGVIDQNDALAVVEQIGSSVE